VAARRIRAYASSRPTIEDAVSFARGFRFARLGIRPVQRPAEITRLLKLIVEEGPQRIVEIGTAAGGTLFLLATFAPDDARIMSIDLPEGYAARKVPLYRKFAREGQRVDLLRADSHAATTVDAVREWLGEESLDLLFIDGDHRYDGVAMDTQLYTPMVRAGGLVVFHDIVPGAPESVGGVPDFWRQVRARSDDVTEIVESWQRGGFGLGVIRKRSASGQPL
jgi:predicted O-methyltransferase YrrM